MDPVNSPPLRDSSVKYEDEILLGVLNAVHREAAISQRTISREVGVALGLANAYLKRCVRKGLIKVQQVPRRRYLYYLTAHGFAEKTRLTGEYLSASFNFFRRARAQLADLMADCSARGWKRVAFAGCSELAEVGIICANEAGLELVGVVDSASHADRFCGLPVFASFEDLPDVDAVIVTIIDRPESVFIELREKTEPARILVPPMLRMAMRILPEREAGQVKP